MLFKRNRFTYLCLVVFVITLGLGTRRFPYLFPNWINTYLGDTLWALMVFFLFGLIFRTKDSRWIAARAILFSYGIEVSQLYHSEWIDILRQTRLGGLVLGYGFLWSDLVSYSIGVGLGMLIERTMILYKERPL